MVKTKSELLKDMLIKEVKKRSWDDLAYDIICLERCVRMKISSKQLKLLNEKLKIWEEEKQLRVVNSFNIGYFIARDLIGF